MDRLVCGLPKQNFLMGKERFRISKREKKLHARNLLNQEDVTKPFLKLARKQSVAGFKELSKPLREV